MTEFSKPGPISATTDTPASDARPRDPRPGAPAVVDSGQTLWARSLDRPDDAAFPWQEAAATPPIPHTGHLVGELTAGPGDVIAVLDPRGVIVSASPNCEPVLGFDREELIGVYANDLLHPEDRASLASATRAFARGLTDHLHSVQRIRHKQLGYRLVETAVRSTAERSAQRPAGAIVLIRIPENPPHDGVRPTVSLAPAAIGTAYAWVMHGSRRAVIASADPVFASLLRTTTANMVGLPIEEITDPDDPGVGMGRFLALLDGSGSTYQVERTLDAGQAGIELTVSLLPLLDRPGRMAVIQARDISRQREMEAAVRTSLSELRRSNRELEAFASVAAHDLAAPLRVVVGYAEMLAKPDEHVNPRIAELLGKVASTSRRMQEQVDGLMTLARMEREELTASSFDLRMLTEEAIGLLQDDISRAGGMVEVGPMPVVTCNATGLVQVLQNLIANAIKYGGARPMVDVSATRQPDGWILSVRDRGIGLPGGQQQDLFELFERGDVPRTPGAGIGLAVCRRIIERHGGRIWCNQRPGGGAEFHFALPDVGPVGTAEDLARTRPETARNRDV